MLLLVAFIVGFMMAFSIGANDVANSMSTAVGSRAITPRQAVMIAAILEFLGALMFGSHVVTTITKGIVKVEFMNDPREVLAGALAALVGSSMWILIATVWGMPVSTTHSIVGGMVGFGIANAGLHAINWNRMASIVISWVLSPVVGWLLAYTVFKIISYAILRKFHPAVAMKRSIPLIIFTTFFIVCLLFALKTVKAQFDRALGWSLLIAAAASVLGSILFRSIRTSGLDEYEYVEAVFKRLQIMTSCYVSFSHGANDVANAIGPVALVYWIISHGNVAQKVGVPVWLLALGGLGISTGALLLGARVMKTVGEEITQLNNSRGFCIDFSTASTVLFASVLGLPISTTHVVVGSVVGVGTARGMELVNVGVLKNILISWFATVPVSALVSAGFYLLMLQFI
ncbi:MAG: Phosphate transporter [Thermotoga sp. 50_1627]|uniref:inorganic phosphate transporter n=1 Tax=Pseudothermotoga sp. TaxID=2033661 RepID=UPI00076D379D|nr:MAG: Phosphate transporter [Thermotoga sp. 50_64]KUK25362.1 MAG: Phosphate transporter [Thermotoga sp. 50_1627]MDK2923121.1 inorganic phosphate transporter, PiT family [Pseudothermotoga sp.]